MQEQYIPEGKRCAACGIEKPLGDFYPRPTGKYGTRSRCKTCQAQGIPSQQPQGRRVEKTCVSCLKVFRVRLSDTARIYCSWACRRAAGRITKVCEKCGKSFTVTKSTERSYRVCSMACRWQPPLISPPHDAWVYAAGIFDGEGMVTVRGKPCYSLAVEICNTDKRLIDWLHDRWGGSIRTQTFANPKHRTRYEWKTSDRHAASFLRGVLPYLIVKREQAEVGVAYREHCDAYVAERHSSRLGLLPEEIAYRDGIYRRLRELKRPEAA